MRSKVVSISGVSKGLGHALAKEFDLEDGVLYAMQKVRVPLIDLRNDLQNKHLIKKQTSLNNLMFKHSQKSPIFQS